MQGKHWEIDVYKRQGFGAGMGLSNMKKNTDRMEIASTVGVGTTVSMMVRIQK